MRPGSASALPHLWGDEGLHYVAIGLAPNHRRIPGVSRYLQYSEYHSGTPELEATAEIAAARRTSEEGQAGLRAFLDKGMPPWRSASSS